MNPIKNGLLLGITPHSDSVYNKTTELTDANNILLRHKYADIYA